MNGLIIIEKVIAKHNNYDIFNKYHKIQYLIQPISS